MSTTDLMSTTDWIVVDYPPPESYYKYITDGGATNGSTTWTTMRKSIGRNGIVMAPQKTWTLSFHVSGVSLMVTHDYKICRCPRNWTVT